MAKTQHLVVWGREGDRVFLAARCAECGGAGDLFTPSMERVDCEHCTGNGWFGIDPTKPVSAHPGSVAKVAMLGVRYAAGVPLWHPLDGPAGAEKAAAMQSKSQTARSVTTPEHHSPSSDSIPASLVP